MSGWVDVQTNAEARAGQGAKNFEFDSSWRQGSFNVGSPGAGDTGAIPPMVMYAALALAAWYFIKHKKG